MLKGKLKHWNDSKGFGFIALNREKDIYIHISALKGMSRRPVMGDIISFESFTDNNGNKKAVNASIEGVSAITRKRHKPQTKESTLANNLLSLAYLVIFLFTSYSFYNKFSSTSNLKDVPEIYESAETELVTTIKARNNQKYSCSGKTNCSQMTSCEEARFYINNCPNTKMDGDGDGIPCESQWCN